MLARLQKATKDKDQGFTLIELLVVIVIIGILAAIAIPLFLNQRQKGVDAGIKSDLKNAATALETESVEGSWSATNGQAVSAVTDFTPTSGNSIVFGGAGGTADGYCLIGTNDNASDDAPFYYNSNTGGLTTTPCPTT